LALAGFEDGTRVVGPYGKTAVAIELLENASGIGAATEGDVRLAEATYAEDSRVTRFHRGASHWNGQCSERGDDKCVKQSGEHIFLLFPQFYHDSSN
jgi:hypothetical protein